MKPLFLPWHRNRLGYRWVQRDNDFYLVDQLQPSRRVEGEWAPIHTVTAYFFIGRAGLDTMSYLHKAGLDQRPTDLIEAMAKIFEPYEYSAVAKTIFADFAATPVTQDGILDFAQKYGPLGVGKKRGKLQLDEGLASHHTCTPTGNCPPFSLHGGESYAYWAQEIKGMKDAITLWQALRNKDREHFLDRASLSEKTFGYWGYSGRSYSIPLPKDMTPTNFPITKKTKSELTWQIRLVGSPLNQTKRKPMNSSAISALGWSVLRKMLSEADISLAEDFTVDYAPPYEISASPLVKRLRPKNLREAMWSELGTAVSGNLSFTNCQFCNEWLWLSPQSPKSRRTQSLFCSDACKQATYRKRRKLARELFDGGVPINEIATAAKMRLSTLNTFLQKEKR